MKKAAVTATFAVLVVVGHASCGVAAEDDLPDEAAIADRRILAVDDGKVPFLADQPFTRESGVEAFVLDAFEHGLSERSVLTLPMLKTEEALARVAAEADLSDEEQSPSNGSWGAMKKASAWWRTNLPQELTSKPCKPMSSGSLGSVRPSRL